MTLTEASCSCSTAHALKNVRHCDAGPLAATDTARISRGGTCEATWRQCADRLSCLKVGGGPAKCYQGCAASIPCPDNGCCLSNGICGFGTDCQ